MSAKSTSSKPTTRRYTPEEKEQAVRMVRALRAELGTSQGTVKRVATQLGYGVESVRSWVRQSEIAGLGPSWGGSGSDAGHGPHDLPVVGDVACCLVRSAEAGQAL